MDAYRLSGAVLMVNQRRAGFRRSTSSHGRWSTLRHYGRWRFDLYSARCRR